MVVGRGEGQRGLCAVCGFRIAGKHTLKVLRWTIPTYLHLQAVWFDVWNQHWPLQPYGQKSQEGQAIKSAYIPICDGLVFAGDDKLLNEYIVTTPEMGANMHRCSLCGKTGSSRSNLGMHIENIHFLGLYPLLPILPGDPHLENPSESPCDQLTQERQNLCWWIYKGTWAFLIGDLAFIGSALKWTFPYACNYISHPSKITKLCLLFSQVFFGSILLPGVWTFHDLGISSGYVSFVEEVH